MPPRNPKRSKTTTTTTASVANQGLNVPQPQPSIAAGTGRQRKQLPFSGDNNGKCKFVELPVEILLEIMSYFPAVHIPTSRRFNTPVLPPWIFQRWDVLRALSQTCRLWRTIFFPLLWERMEACAVRTELSLVPSEVEPDIISYRGDAIPVNWYKGVSRLLENLSKGLIADPAAAECVRTVNVSLTRCSYDTVLSAFVQCLERLPNLRTLQILRAHSQMTKMLETHFEGHTFPAVQTIIVPDHGHQILRCCPEVKRVICNNGDGSKIITAIAKQCKKVEVLEGIWVRKNIVKRAVRACPNLRRLSLRGSIDADPDILSLLAPLRNLTRIEAQVQKNYGADYAQDPTIAQIIKLAKSSLGNNAEGEKKLRLWYQFISQFQGIQQWSVEISL